jgi:hypothetical protein
VCFGIRFPVNVEATCRTKTLFPVLQEMSICEVWLCWRKPRASFLIEDLSQLGFSPNQNHQASLAHRRLSSVGSIITTKIMAKAICKWKPTSLLLDFRTGDIFSTIAFAYDALT